MSGFSFFYAPYFGVFPMPSLDGSGHDMVMMWSWA
jgi:hypothetical protein